MTEEIIIHIIPDTPENLIESMDKYTQELLDTPWYDFARKKMLKRFIINTHIKRLELLNIK